MAGVGVIVGSGVGVMVGTGVGVAGVVLPPLLPPPDAIWVKLAVTVVSLAGIVNWVVALDALAKLPPFELLHPLNRYPAKGVAVIDTWAPGI